MRNVFALLCIDAASIVSGWRWILARDREHIQTPAILLHNHRRAGDMQVGETFKGTKSDTEKRRSARPNQGCRTWADGLFYCNCFICFFWNRKRPRGRVSEPVKGNMPQLSQPNLARQRMTLLGS